MRLNKIKLAGFKSFVDPTTIHLLSNLVAVVGPNGCGKSNVIDAVRWVMGESSAKYLRGGALTDVIFSGSSARKPVGQATVELLFDNTEGKLGGEYAAYSEIAIKRQVTRDGQSNYFLNGQRCRRRDITDIFLGTGLGPRSYSIIEQGMISRVIEAKPEDLRVFLEEAAGISKYKERRRETENRIQHTNDNLARLNDLRGELDKQLRHLERQAQAAEKYSILKAQEQEMGLQLAAMMWQRLDEEIKEHEHVIRQTTTKLEGEQASLQTVKTQQEKQRSEQTDAQDALNEVQKHYYGVGTEIAQIEQAMQHHFERQQQLQVDKTEAQELLAATKVQLEQDHATILSLQASITETEPKHQQAFEKAEQAVAIQQQAEFALEEWRDNLSQLQQAALDPTRQAEAEKAKITQLERQIHQMQERQKRLDNDIAQLHAPHHAIDLVPLNDKIHSLDEKLSLITEQLETKIAERNTALQQMNSLRPQVKDSEQALNGLQGQQAALKALQAQALGKDQAIKQTWLQNKGIVEQYLAEKIQVVSGWENAVEIVLCGFLDAFNIEQNKLLSLAPDLLALQENGASLVEWQSTKMDLSNIAQTALIHLVKGGESLPMNLAHMLAQTRACATLDEAIALLPKLSANESVVTQEGCWLGQGWAKVQAKQTAAGILIREEKVHQLAKDVALQEGKLAELQAALDLQEEILKELDIAKEALQDEKNRVHQEKSALGSEYKIKQNRIEQDQKRVTQLQQEIAECLSLIQSHHQEVTTARSHLHEAVDKMAQLNELIQTSSSKKQALQEEVAANKLEAKGCQQQANEIALALQTFRTQLQSITQNVQRGQAQSDNIVQRIQNLELALIKNAEPVEKLKFTLEANLEKRIAIEAQLNDAREKVAEIDGVFRELEQKSKQCELTIAELREKLEETKMQWQALLVRRETTTEKLKDITVPIEELLLNLPPEADEALWQHTLQDIEQKIQRLGAINLAAIEEFSTAQQRKEYLDSQCNDLTEALATLDNAIKKIDRETREKFKETFNQVNAEFTQRFPKLFGGGHANLVLTGEDLLDTGITVMARPPGKKNSTIQQLSGGEKALTAIALVFSIFQLNPAPFCMLDEVDAPLDDNNVSRFCDLVKDMAQKIQLIYVSHNKLAIEMAEQLQGVTMREPGVSRLVTVNIEEAKSMAEA